MGAYHHEHQEFATVEIWRVDHHVIQVLPRHRLMIGNDHIVRLETVLAISLHPIDDDHAEISNEVRDAAHVLGDQLALGVEKCSAIVAHLVNHHVVGGALQVSRHFIGDGRQRVADDLERDGVKSHEPLRQQ